MHIRVGRKKLFSPKLNASHKKRCTLVSIKIYLNLSLNKEYFTEPQETFMSEKIDLKLLKYAGYPDFTFFITYKWNRRIYNIEAFNSLYTNFWKVKYKFNRAACIRNLRNNANFTWIFHINLKISQSAFRNCFRYLVFSIFMEIAWKKLQPDYWIFYRAACQIYDFYNIIN